MSTKAVLRTRCHTDAALADMDRRFATAWRSGRSSAHVFTCESPAALFRILTPKRWELLERLQALGPTTRAGTGASPGAGHEAGPRGRNRPARGRPRREDRAWQDSGAVLGHRSGFCVACSMSDRTRLCPNTPVCQPGKPLQVRPAPQMLSIYTVAKRHLVVPQS